MFLFVHLSTTNLLPLGAHWPTYFDFRLTDSDSNELTSTGRFSAGLVGATTAFSNLQESQEQAHGWISFDIPTTDAQYAVLWSSNGTTVRPHFIRTGTVPTMSGGSVSSTDASPSCGTLPRPSIDRVPTTGEVFSNVVNTPSVVPSGGSETLTATMVPSDSCKASIYYATGEQQPSFNWILQPADPTGTGRWTWLVDTAGTTGTALVVCTDGVDSASTLTQFRVSH